MTYLHKTKTRHFTTFTVYIFSNIPRKLGRLKAIEIPPVLHPFLEIWPICIRQKHATSQLLQFIFSVTFQENSEDLKHLRYHLFFFSSNLEVLHGFFPLFLCSVSVFTVVIVVYFLLLVVCFFLFFSNRNFCVRCTFRIFCFILAEKEFKWQTSKYFSLFRYISSTGRRQSFF